MWVADGSVDESRSLFNWLRDEPQVRRHGESAVRDSETLRDGEGGTGHMGTTLDVLGLVLGSGLSTAQLVLSIIRWRASSGRPVRVIVEHDGREVAVDTDDPGEAEGIAGKIELD